MQGTKILAVAVEVVVFLFAAFGGFLAGIAPPEEADAEFAVGLGSFLALGILLWMAAAKRSWFRGRRRNVWLVIAATFLVLAPIVSALYWHQRSRLTFGFPPGQVEARYLAGTELTSAGRRYIEIHSGTKTAAEMVDEFGGLASRELIWTRESIGRAQMLLVALYLSSVLAISVGIFSLTEGLLVKTNR